MSVIVVCLAIGVVVMLLHLILILRVTPERLSVIRMTIFVLVHFLLPLAQLFLVVLLILATVLFLLLLPLPLILFLIGGKVRLLFLMFTVMIWVVVAVLLVLCGNVGMCTSIFIMLSFIFLLFFCFLHSLLGKLLLVFPLCETHWMGIVVGEHLHNGSCLPRLGLFLLCDRLSLFRCLFSRIIDNWVLEFKIVFLSLGMLELHIMVFLIPFDSICSLMVIFASAILFLELPFLFELFLVMLFFLALLFPFVVLAIAIMFPLMLFFQPVSLLFFSFLLLLSHFLFTLPLFVLIVAHN